ncbi:MAG: alcohol dehydrogenase catalytic domain-containing protein [Bacteroidales bacterium]
MPIPEKMKALVLNPSTRILEVHELPVPSPGPGEVLIRMQAAPVNPSDLARIKEFRQENPGIFVPGIEGCGTVVKAGPGLLPRLWLGRRMACISTHQHSGTWAGYMVTGAGRCFPLPASIPDDQGSMLFVNPLTALAFFEIIRARKTRAVISLAAASALGRMISVLGEKRGVAVINVVRRPAHVQLLKEINAPVILDTSESDFDEKLEKYIAEFSPGLLLDPIGGDMDPDIFDLMPPGSLRLIYGRLSTEFLRMDPHTLIGANKSVNGFFLANWLQAQGLLKTITLLVKARRLLANDVKVPIRERVPLEEINPAIQRYVIEMSGGKIILTP